MGGIFTSQNKIRSGTYINFEGVLQPTSKLGSRGIMTMPVAMGWGAQITELLSTDLVDGKSIPKIGLEAQDIESLVYRLALANCHKAIVYRIDSGGTAATASIDDLDLTAKYAGILGNEIQVTVIADGTNFDVVTYYKGVQQDIQTVGDATELVDNDWVNFAHTTGVLTANAGTTLTGGLNGSVLDTNYTDYLTAIQAYQFNTMAIPQDVSTTVDNEVITAVKSMRDDEGKKVQVVLYDVTADNEAVINVEQGFKTTTETVSAQLFPAYVAGITAGAQAAESNTYHVIEDAVDIVNPYTNTEIIAKLKVGTMVLSTRVDGAIVIEQDINTFHTFTNDNGYVFSKNRVIRTLDEINNSVSLMFARSYIGKVSNVADGRQLFKGDLIQYFNELQSTGAIQNFNSATDIEVLAGQAIDAVVVNVAVQPVDSMEKLYMTVKVG